MNDREPIAGRDSVTLNAWNSNSMSRNLTVWWLIKYRSNVNYDQTDYISSLLQDGTFKELCGLIATCPN
jgi:hypothetical protein